MLHKIIVWQLLCYVSVLIVHTISYYGSTYALTHRCDIWCFACLFVRSCWQGPGDEADMSLDFALMCCVCVDDQAIVWHLCCGYIVDVRAKYKLCDDPNCSGQKPLVCFLKSNPIAWMVDRKSKQVILTSSRTRRGLFFYAFSKPCVANKLLLLASQWHVVLLVISAHNKLPSKAPKSRGQLHLAIKPTKKLTQNSVEANQIHWTKFTHSLTQWRIFRFLKLMHKLL